MALQLTRRRFTIDEYHRMAEAGILHEDDRVELIDGEIIEMTPIGGRHLDAVVSLNHACVIGLGDVARVSVQNPIQLVEGYEPQPDVSILRPRSGRPKGQVPRVEEVYFVVEVADTSLEIDRQKKIPHYARAGIPEAWLADLEHDLVEVYRDPTPDGYRTIRIARRGEKIAPLAFPDRPIAVADILG